MGFDNKGHYIVIIILEQLICRRREYNAMEHL
jgi:hypothetical protein